MQVHARCKCVLLTGCSEAAAAAAAVASLPGALHGSPVGPVPCRTFLAVAAGSIVSLPKLRILHIPCCRRIDGNKCLCGSLHGTVLMLRHAMIHASFSRVQSDPYQNSVELQTAHIHVCVVQALWLELAMFTTSIEMICAER